VAEGLEFGLTLWSGVSMRSDPVAGGVSIRSDPVAGRLAFGLTLWLRG